MSQLFLRTLREDPADAEVPSHRLLVRAGYIRRAASGGYTWLPLGYRVLRKVEQVVRDEMDAAGFQEVHFPALLPREPYERSGRWTDYGDDLFRLQDRKGADHLLAPTHEEMFTLLVKDLYSSHKDLPTSIYQIQWKFRDEPRPRAGLLRGREFLMKDSYSFDLDDAGLAASYGKHREAYQRLFDRLGVHYVIVSAMSGAMGGSASEEFLLPTEVGEDTYVRCTSCDYAANTEAVTTPPPTEPSTDGVPAAHVENTPDTPTIDTLVAVSNERADLRRADREWSAADTLKNVVVTLRYPDGRTEPLVIGVPGDREVDLKRLGAAVAPAVPDAFGEDDFAAHPVLVRGYIGPQILGERNASGVRYLTDPRIVPGTRWITGANQPGRHVYDLVAGRDFTADGTIEAAEVRAGDVCPTCGAPLEIARGLEIGHIFQLGRKYAEALDLTVQDESGGQVVVTMGSYGVGVSRLVAAIAEQTHDEKGLCWPVAVAPAQVHVVVAGKGDEIVAAAESLADSLASAGHEVLLDDRKASVGVKFADAELIGVPVVVVVGRGLKDGVVEVRDRSTGGRDDVAVEAAPEHVAAMVGGSVTAQ
ncbi:MAG: proline--tRNA ligase [Jiangellales bacterium]